MTDAEKPTGPAGAERPWENPRPLSQRIAPLFFGLAIGFVILGFMQVAKHRAVQQQQQQQATATEGDDAAAGAETAAEASPGGAAGESGPE